MDDEIHPPVAEPQTIYLGYRGFPYPTLRDNDKIGVLDGAIGFPSYIPPARANAIAYRYMPTPEQLPYFHDVLAKRIAPPGGVKSAFITGDPATGKSFLADLLALMMTGKYAERFEAANRNLADIFYVTALDFEANRTYFERISSKFSEGRLSAQAIILLKKAFGEHINEAEKTIDWNGIVADNKNAAQDYETIKRIAELEGLNGSSSGIGLKTVKSVIPRALEGKTVALIDELTDIKGLTAKSAQLFLQLLKGEVEQVVLPSSIGTQITLHRRDLPETFFALFTANPAGDAISTQDLPIAVTSRLSPHPFERLTERGWAHRICQELTGMPITTLYDAYEKTWKANPELFPEFLQHIRSQKITSDEVVPEWQLDLLGVPMDIKAAAEKLAQFAHYWQETLASYRDPGGKCPAEIEAEMDNSYVRNTWLSPRQIKDLILDALEPVPGKIEHQGRSNALGGSQNLKTLLTPAHIAGDWALEDKLATFGTRLERGLYDFILSKTAGRPAMQARLLGKAKDSGCLNLSGSSGGGLAAPKANKSKTFVSGLLNVRSTIAAKRQVETERLRGNIIGSLARQSGMEIKAVQSLLPGAILTAALEARRNDSSLLISFAADPSTVSATRVQGDLLTTLKAVDVSSFKPTAANGHWTWHDNGERSYDPGNPSGEVASLNQFLSGLALLGKNAIPNDILFSPVADSVTVRLNDGERIAHGVHEAGYGTKFVCVEHNNALAPVLVLKSDQNVVFMGAFSIEPALENELQNSGIDFIDVRDTGSNKIAEKIGTVLQSDSKSVILRQRLAQAVALQLTDEAVQKVKGAATWSFSTPGKSDLALAEMFRVAATESGAVKNYSIVMRAPWRLAEAQP